MIGECRVISGDYVRLTDLDADTLAHPMYVGKSATLHFSRSAAGVDDIELTFSDDSHCPSLDEKLVGRRLRVELWSHHGTDDLPSYSYFEEVFTVMSVSNAELILRYLSR